METATDGLSLESEATTVRAGATTLQDILSAQKRQPAWRGVADNYSIRVQ